MRSNSQEYSEQFDRKGGEDVIYGVNYVEGLVLDKYDKLMDGTHYYIFRRDGREFEIRSNGVITLYQRFMKKFPNGADIGAGNPVENKNYIKVNYNGIEYYTLCGEHSYFKNGNFCKYIKLEIFSDKKFFNGGKSRIIEIYQNLSYDHKLSKFGEYDPKLENIVIADFIKAFSSRLDEI